MGLRERVQMVTLRKPRPRGTSFGRRKRPTRATRRPSESRVASEKSDVSAG